MSFSYLAEKFDFGIFPQTRPMNFLSILLVSLMWKFMLSIEIFAILHSSLATLHFINTCQVQNLT